MAGDMAAMREWITERICETRWLAEEARAAAYDIEDQAVLDATVQLADDLEGFAARLAHGCSRLTLSNSRDASPPRKRRDPAGLTLRPPPNGRASPTEQCPCVAAGHPLSTVSSPASATGSAPQRS